MSKYAQKAASGLIKTGFGKVMGMFCSASSSLVAQLVDGINDNDDAADKATGTLTSSGAMVPAKHATSEIVSSGACAPADYATNTLTADTTAFEDESTITIGATVYRFMGTMAQAYDVKRTGTVATDLANLEAAINASGTAGVEYFAGTLVNPDVIADTAGATTLKVWARTIGTVPNSLDTLASTSPDSHLDWADTTLGGGTGASNPGVAITAAQIVLGSRTYTAVLNLAETIGLTAVADQILWETSEAVFLDNVKLAVNAGAGEGTKYGTGTTAHEDVIATTNSDTVQTFLARTVGNAAFTSAVNALATTTTLGNYAWAATTFGGGTGNSDPAVANTAAQFTVDERTYTIVNELSETSGATAVVDQILYGGNEATMLDNIKVAFENGSTEGTNYSTGTVAHVTVEATTNTNTTQLFEARTAGTGGNSIAVSETMANHTFGVGVTTLLGGLAGQSEIIEEFPLVAGTFYPFSIKDGLSFETGLYYRLISGTGEVTIEYE